MRIDKYLWAIRVFKSRSLASQHCKAGKVKIGETEVKASREIKLNEVVDVRKASITYSYKVIEFPKSRVSAKLVENYTVDVTSKEELEKLEMIKLSAKFERPRGLGRPTKKDRRTINRFKKDD